VATGSLNHPCAFPVLLSRQNCWRYVGKGVVYSETIGTPCNGEFVCQEITSECSACVLSDDAPMKCPWHPSKPPTPP
jgi:hypothetical protein